MVFKWTLSTKIVFSNRWYILLAGTTTAAFWIIFSALDGLLLFSPFAFYYPIPPDAIPGFMLSNITAPLAGVIISMNAYMYKNSLSAGSKSLFSGSILGTASSVCAGCSSIGFYMSTTFGTAGVAASTFLSNYQLPLRLAAIGLLIWSYYTANRGIVRSCAISKRQ
jgi:hypothetical protein